MVLDVTKLAHEIIAFNLGIRDGQVQKKKFSMPTHKSKTK